MATIFPVLSKAWSSVQSRPRLLSCELRQATRLSSKDCQERPQVLPFVASNRVARLRTHRSHCTERCEIVLLVSRFASPPCYNSVLFAMSDLPFWINQSLKRACLGAGFPGDMAQKGVFINFQSMRNGAAAPFLRLYLWRFWCYKSGNFRKVRAVRVLPAY